MNNLPYFHVAVGIIFNSSGKVLIANRPPQKYLPGLWEFPGGKVEDSETVLQALIRELQEELGIDVQTAEEFTQIDHTYPDRIVLLDVWRIYDFHGEPSGLEGQEVRWVLPEELENYEFPSANHEIVQAILSLKKKS